MASVTYTAGAELPDLTLTWRDSAGVLIDFTSAYTFTVKVGVPGSAAVFTKTTGITGAATDPNITIAWATTAELSTLTVGTTYTGQVIARRTSDSKDRYFPGGFTIYVDTAIT